MTTSAQQTVLTEQEIDCLRAIAQGTAHAADQATIAALAAKGMLGSADASSTLTPAGQHAIHVNEPGCVPGIDT